MILIKKKKKRKDYVKFKTESAPKNSGTHPQQLPSDITAVTGDDPLKHAHSALVTFQFILHKTMFTDNGNRVSVHSAHISGPLYPETLGQSNTVYEYITNQSEFNWEHTQKKTRKNTAIYLFAAVQNNELFDESSPASNPPFVVAMDHAQGIFTR